jgi:hypothetical protein
MLLAMDCVVLVETLNGQGAKVTAMYRRSFPAVRIPCWAAASGSRMRHSFSASAQLNDSNPYPRFYRCMASARPMQTRAFKERRSVCTGRGSIVDSGPSSTTALKLAKTNNAIKGPQRCVYASSKRNRTGNSGCRLARSRHVIIRFSV